MVTPLLLLALLRLSLAVAGVLLAVAFGVDGRVALVTAVVAAAFCGFAFISAGRPHGRLQVAPDAPREPAWRTALRASYPSTIGLTALTALSLAFKPQLAAFTGGTLAALGLMAVAVAAQVRWEER